jgi:hypothetical protein
MGIPVIANDIGDVAGQVTHSDVGCIVDTAHPHCAENVRREWPKLLEKDPKSIRKVAEHTFSLARGVVAYKEIYRFWNGKQR